VTRVAGIVGSTAYYAVAAAGGSSAVAVAWAADSAVRCTPLNRLEISPLSIAAPERIIVDNHLQKRELRYQLALILEVLW